ncbi:Eco57I restriction-modification methylase domain-containing protein [Flavobacterium sp.]|uniref:type IIG restriction enzyme/methyltransferase n=1 Tax=Flavobacterium sp. TaxID=239 RepID=UPI0037530B64
MKLLKIKPSKSLNKAYYKQSLTREQIELFKKELQNTFNHIDEKQDEEYHKNVIADLFKNVYCKDKHLVNVNKKEDLVIRLGNSTTDDVGVLLEFKKPTEKRDMVSAANANVKALQEVVLYYLRQTVDYDNHKITNLIVTNIYEWFIFDGVWFEKNIFRNVKLKKDYLAFKSSGHDTKYFYDTIAAKYLAEFTEEVSCTYFNLKDYEKKITNDNKKDDNDLIDLYKILSPEHLLNKKFANDSNSLNTDFYNELLYIIGLEESKDTAKKTIRRINEAERNEGSLIENTIAKLKTKKYFGFDTNDAIENQYYEIALELCITWLNRILFLKLLESQLIKYHNNDENYAFLSYSKIKDFDELEELFFEVLAEKTADRKSSVAQKYVDIPYLNSSLFEMTDLEKNAIALSNLKDRLEFPVYKKSVLKKGTKEVIKPKTSLNYLLDFLDAYNFASESNAKIQEENKSIINASVLGLIFEKINGYKDGSFFTPGFITMYMCRETIRKAVVEKFKTNFPFCQDITNYEELKEKIDFKNKAERAEANRLINEIKIVDPAVGSGHFLVSALNEMIATKSDLQILSYKNDNRVLGYTITLENDELIIQNQETDKLFEYNLNQNNNIITDLQDLQECLFTEKQKIIENCLFGVDINPKSVMICQLRLWIELLKNAYYTKESNYKELHTLPNIDINIKTGNSLISKFAIKDNVFERITGFQKKLQEYKTWVSIYKDTNDKKAKDELKKKLKLFKDEFKLADLRVTKLQNDLRILNGVFYEKYQTYQVFGSELTDKEVTAKEKLQAEIQDKQVEIQTVKDNPIYKDAFEWRYEFPEVLDDKGDFIGFDVVIGNPPYIKEYEGKHIFDGIRENEVYQGKMDIWYMFACDGLKFLKPNGLLSYIAPNNWVTNSGASKTRNFILKNSKIEQIIDFGSYMIFDTASIQTMIMTFKKDIQNEYNFDYRKIETTKPQFNDAIEILTNSKTENNVLMQPNIVVSNSLNQFLTFNNNVSDSILNKIATKKNFDLNQKTEIAQGIVFPQDFINKLSNEVLDNTYKVGDGIFALSEKEKDDLNLSENELRLVKPYFNSEQFSRYFATNKNEYWLIYTSSKFKNPSEIKPYPNIKEHLDKFQSVITSDNKPYGLHRTREENFFKGEKIIVQRKCAGKPVFTYTDFDTYVSATFYVIKTERVNQKYLTGLFNSKLIEFWLRNKGKMQGNNFQLDKEPLLNIPIFEPNKDFQKPIISLVDQILTLKKENPKADTSDLENDIDELVYQLYELTYDEIDVVKSS